MPLQILRLVPSLFHETGRSQGRFLLIAGLRQDLIHIIIIDNILSR